MKNAIVILVDSIFSDCISNKRTKESSTPFIDSLRNNCLFADSVYSFGPYTDAASKGLYCGNRSLDDYGYYFGMNSSNYNIHRVFKENGYETFAFYYPYYLIGSKVEKYIDHISYTSGFVWSSVWFGKYKDYSELLKKRDLSVLEYKILEKFTDFLFDVWRSFYRTLNESEQARCFVNELKESCTTGGEYLLESEYKKYISDKRIYIIDLLEKGEDHPLSKVNDYNPDNYAQKVFLKKIYAENKVFFCKLIVRNFILNIKNNKISVVSGLKELLAQGVKNSTFTRWLLCIWAPIVMMKRSFGTQWRFEPSFYNQIMKMFAQLDEREQTEKPFFFSLHTEDAHQNISFFSYDMNDTSVVKEELEYLEPLLRGSGKNYVGNLTYQLSLRYTDLCVKRLYAELEKRNLLENTSIVLMADHGSSFAGFPIRDTVVNNFHVENYKTPFMIWNYEPRSFNGYYGNKYSADMVLPTICKSLGFEIPKDICQSTIIDMPEGKPYIITEYMGGGCPDMISKEIWLSARNDNYCVAYKSKIDKPFDMNHPCCIYDLKNDKNEYKNLSNANYLGFPEIIELSLKIKDRFEQIQKDTQALLMNLDHLKVTEDEAQ